MYHTRETAQDKSNFYSLTKLIVYCFGIIILEIITGRGRTSSKDDEIAQDLSDWVRMVMNNDWSTNILDVEIVGAREGHNEMLSKTRDNKVIDCFPNQ